MEKMESKLFGFLPSYTHALPPNSNSKFLLTKLTKVISNYSISFCIHTLLESVAFRE